MSAMEIIEQIKKLPPEDVRILREFLAEKPFNALNEVAPGADDKDFERVADEVFTRFDGLLRRLAK
jgi:hypothetical protein